MEACRNHRRCFKDFAMNRQLFAANTKETIKIFDGLFTWENQLNVSKCRLEVYTIGRKKLAIAHEISENNGMSITNGAEILWLNVIKRFGDCSCFETYNDQSFDL